MHKLPIISGQEAVKALRKIGYEPDHQTGSHIILRHKEIAKGTLKSIFDKHRK